MEPLRTKALASWSAPTTVFVTFFTVVSTVAWTRANYISGFPGGAPLVHHDSRSGGAELPERSLNHLQYLWPQGDPPLSQPGRDLQIFIDETTNLLAAMWVI